MQGEAIMKKVLSISVAGLAMTGLLAAPVTLAGERGKFVGHAVLNNTKFNEYKTPDGHPYKAAWSGEQEGLIFHNGSGNKLDKLLDRAHYIVQWVGDGGTLSGYCMKTFTTTEGHKLFARCDWKGNDKGSSGLVTLLGGTGPFAGIKGKGKFNFVGVTSVVNYDDIEWEWETP
jgi:hypothetical protein